MISPHVPVPLLDLPVLTPTLWDRALGEVKEGGLFMVGSFKHF